VKQAGFCCWLNPDRVEEDYLPTGFRVHGMKTRAVEGHPFELEHADEERKALIALLKTLQNVRLVARQRPPSNRLRQRQNDYSADYF